MIREVKFSRAYLRKFLEMRDEMRALIEKQQEVLAAIEKLDQKVSKALGEPTPPPEGFTPPPA